MSAPRPLIWTALETLRRHLSDTYQLNPYIGSDGTVLTVIINSSDDHVSLPTQWHGFAVFYHYRSF